MATRAQIEELLLKRVGRWMAEVGMDNTTISGTNADIDDPLGFAIRRLGGSVANPVSVSDGDVSGIDGSEFDKLMDYAELRLLKNILGNMEFVDTSGLPMSMNNDQLGKRIQKRIDDLQQYIKDNYPADESGYTVQTYSMTRVDGYSDDIAANEV
jgi:hypothetical protein